RRQPQSRKGSGRGPGGGALPSLRQGHACPAVETIRRDVHSSSCRGAAKTQQTPARIAERIRAIVVRGDAAGNRGVLRSGQGILGPFQRGLRKLPLDPRKSGLYRFRVQIGSHSTALAAQMPLPALQLLERKLEKQKRLFELRRGALERRIEQQIQLFEERKG